MALGVGTGRAPLTPHTPVPCTSRPRATTRRFMVARRIAGEISATEISRVGMLVAATAVVAATFLYTPDGPRSADVGLASGPAHLLAVVTSASTWRIFGIVAIAAALLLWRARRLADPLFLLASACGWALGPGPYVLSLLVWIGFPVMAVIGSGVVPARAVRATAMVVFLLAAAIWLSWTVSYRSDTWSLQVVGAAIACVLSARTFAGGAIDLLGAVRLEQAEYLRLGVTVPTAFAFANRLVPGRGVSRLAASEVARSAIATDLHSEVMPRVLAVIHQAERMGADEIAFQARGVSDTLRAVMGRERPVSLEVLGLSLALESLAADLQQRRVLSVSVSADLAGQPPTLVARAAYRCAQEWLENVGRHAHARSVRVEATGTARWLDLRIVDDGTTRPEAAEFLGKDGHIGLTSLGANTEAVRATFNVGPAANGGTMMTWQWRK